ncbi:hypothetical protein HYX70_00035 [Candidatus Saccharibacteria bacterium]|nr:hypothetical protein [Candidatus Saccharibacteria bacterium]
MSRDQRYIFLVSALQALLGLFLLYFTPYQVILPVLVLALNYFLFRRLILSKRRGFLLIKSLRSSLWLLLWFFYLFSINSINLIPLPLFVGLTVIGGGLYGLICYLDIQQNTRMSLQNILTTALLVLATTCGSLAIIFWHWPLAIILLLFWLVNFTLALLWLLEFTNNPQILATLWALAATELFWIASRWVILYRVPRSSLMISQISLIIGALAYCWGGIYFHHKNQTLKRSLLFEYIVVSSVIFIVLVLLSRWSVAL